MKTAKMHVPLISRISGLSILLLMSTVPADPQVSAQHFEALALARVEILGRVDQLPLPVFAILHGADGSDYALTIATPFQIQNAGESYRILDFPADPRAYVIAGRVRKGNPGSSRPHSAAPLRSSWVLYDDGRQTIARASEDEAEALAMSGYEIARLPELPLVFPPATKTTNVARLAAALAFTPTPDVQEMMDEVTLAKVQTYEGNLCGEWPVTIGGASYTITTRHTRSGTPIAMATQYVYEFMQSLGLQVSYQNWASGSYSGRNVVGTMIGTTLPNEVVLITAHLDDVPSSGPAPGADDNASGSAAVMMAAEILSRRQFQRTVCFVFFTGEEQAVLGSTAYAAAAYSSGQNIVGVLNLDMISWDKAGGPVVGLHTRSTGNPGYAADKSIADLFTNVVASYGLSDKITPLLISDGWAYSDHAAFWNKGYPAIVAMEDENNDFNPYYHSSNDLPTTLNFVYFTNFMKAAVGTVAHLCSSSDSGIPQAIARIKATPTTGAAPFAVAFDGSASSGSTGTIVSYDWNFGDGATGSGATVNHTYTAAGAYTASLTVTDTAGATDVAIVTIAANSSDLRARTASLSVDSAGMLKIFASVINDGTVSTGTGFKNAHYLSADAVLDPGVDRLIYENSRTTALEAGQTWSYTASLSIAGVEPGSYYLILSTDSAKAIAEGNEANNVLASAPVALRPDLFFSTLEFSSTGTAVTSSLTLKNLGPARQALPVTVGVYISTDTTITKSDILCGTYTTPAGTIFEPGVTLKQTVTFPVPLGTPAGYYYMGAIADPANAIAEWNKSNNTASARNRVRLKR